MATNNRGRGRGRSGRNNNPEGRNQYSGMMGTARGNPIATAAAVGGTANIPAAANASSAKYRFLFGMSVSRSTKSIPGTKTSQLIMTKGQKRVSGDTSETVTMASEAAIDTANQSLAMLNSGLRSISAA